MSPDTSISKPVDHMHRHKYETTPPLRIPGVGELQTDERLIAQLAKPFSIEVIGMPETGKTTHIERLIRELNQINPEKVHVLPESAEGIKSRYGSLRQSDPAQYAHLTAVLTRMRYFDAITAGDTTPDAIIADRGLTDFALFHRTYEARGQRVVQLPEVDEEVAEWLVDPPIELGGVILFLARPEVSFARAGGRLDRGFFDDLYRQYLGVKGQKVLVFIKV